MQASTNVLGLCSAVFVSLISIVLLIPLATRLNLVDHPGGRKHHAIKTPLIGGLAIYLGLLASLFFIPSEYKSDLGVLFGGGLLLFVGLVDDRFDLTPKLRLLIQIIAAASITFFSHAAIYYVGSMFFVPEVSLNMLALPVTVFVAVSFINAVNMLDGQDGLAGGIVLTEALLLLGVSIYLEQPAVSMMLGVFLLLIIVFLLFNAPLPGRKYARIFLGDSGSNFIAFFIAWAVIVLSQVQSDLISPVTLFWIVGLPFFDILGVVLMRRALGRSPLKPGHDHIHHLLQKKKLSIAKSTLLLSLASLGLGLIGLLLAWMHVPEKWQTVMLLLIFLSYFKIVRRLHEGFGDKPLSEVALQPEL